MPIEKYAEIMWNAFVDWSDSGRASAHLPPWVVREWEKQPVSTKEGYAYLAQAVLDAYKEDSSVLSELEQRSS